MDTLIDSTVNSEERQVDLALRVLRNYFMFRGDGEMRIAEDFLGFFAPHLNLDIDMARWAYDSGREEARFLLITHPEYVISHELYEMN